MRHRVCQRARGRRDRTGGRRVAAVLALALSACTEPPRVETPDGARAELGAWAGLYRLPAGTTWSTLALDAEGFHYLSGGCIGLYADVTGRVVVHDDRVELIADGDSPLVAGDVVDDELAKVEWGERRYLVPVARLAAFCNAVNSGSEGASSPDSFLLLEGGDALPRPGLPRVPAEFAAYLLERPIEARVLAVDRSAGPERLRVTIDRGADDGVLEGMSFHADGGAFDVVETQPGTAVAEARSALVHGEGVEAGTPLSTRLPARAPRPAGEFRSE